MCADARRAEPHLLAPPVVAAGAIPGTSACLAFDATPPSRLQFGVFVVVATRHHAVVGGRGDAPVAYVCCDRLVSVGVRVQVATGGVRRVEEDADRAVACGGAGDAGANHAPPVAAGDANARQAFGECPEVGVDASACVPEVGQLAVDASACVPEVGQLARISQAPMTAGAVR